MFRLNTRRLIANSARRAIMQAGRKPTHAAAAHIRSMPRPDDTRTLMADRRFPAR